MPRSIVMGFGTPVTVNGTAFVTRSGRVAAAVGLHDVSGTGAAGLSGTGRERAYGLDEFEVDLMLQLDANQPPHSSPFNLADPRTDIAEIKIYHLGPNGTPITLLNVKCDKPFEINWDAPNPNTMSIHGFTPDATWPT